MTDQTDRLRRAAATPEGAASLRRLYAALRDILRKRQERESDEEEVFTDYPPVGITYITLNIEGTEPGLPILPSDQESDDAAA